MSGAVAGATPAGGPVRVPVGGVLTPRMERFIRLGSVGSALIIAVSAMVLSYAGLHDLALDAKIHPRLALLVPIMVDGLQFVGSLGVVYSTLSGLRSWYPWLLMLMGVSISAWGNWQAAPDDMTAKLLHAAAPVILALVLEELLRVMRHKVHLHTVAWEAEHAGTEHQVSHLDIPDDSHGEVEAEASATPPAPVVAEDPAPEPEGSAEDRFVSTVFGRESVASGEHPQMAAPSADAVREAVSTEAAPVDTWTPREPVIPASALRASEPVAVEPVAVEPVAVEPAVAQSADDEPLFPVTEQPTAPVAAPAAPVAESPAAPVEYDDDTLPPYPEDATFKDQIKAILTADPSTSAAKIARIMVKDKSWTRRNVREARAELDTEAAESVASEPTPPAPVAVAPVAEKPAVPEPTSVPASVVRPVADDDLNDADPFAMSTPVYAAH